MSKKARARGTTVHIGTTAADHLADSYIELEGTVNISGNIGIRWPEGDITALKDEYKRTGKVGPADAGRCTISGHLEEAVETGLPPGLARLSDAAHDDDIDAPINIKVVKSNGRVKYLRAAIFEFTEVVGSNQALLGFNSVAILQQAASDAAPEALAVPVTILLPSIVGAEVKVGVPLTGIVGAYTNNPTAFSYVWQHDDAGDGDFVPIDGAVLIGYTPEADLAGDRLRFGVTPINGAGSGTPVYSLPTTLVEAAE